MGDVAIHYDPVFLQHDPGAYHPECALRLEAVKKRFDQIAIFDTALPLNRRQATVEEIRLNHTEAYIEKVRSISLKGGGRLDPDTVLSAETYDVALYAVGAGLEAADQIMSGALKRAFLLLRPPGHHALSHEGMGFCFFNNIAITARYLKQKHKLSRIAIVDWDVHHGNGTQDSFYEDPEVLFISLHQYPHYPGTGSVNEKGSGPGTGYTINLPFRAGSGDPEYRRAFEKSVIPALEDYKPQIILISAGFDGHEADPLGGLMLQSESYAWMTKMLRDVAEKHCEGRIISFLEGGYDLDALSDSCEAHARAMM
jgi:acetoin utilization deacetylase AcuC-like enzyme